VSSPDLSDMLRRAKEVQERVASLQRELARRTVEGSAGAGLVTAVASGELRLLRIEIDPQLLAGGDRAMIQDLVAAAANAALERAQRMVQEEMQRAAGSFAALADAGGPSAPESPDR
jgi:DNA-binding YbaB/EbfC family protein